MRVQRITTKTRSPKETKILDCALKLLIEKGDAGLTLRKLAEYSDMRLSNVQYYFASRDDVIAAMVARYFNNCAENLLNQTKNSTAKTKREKVAFLVSAGLAHGQEISDMCRAFREIWAISSRSTVIDECLMDYYRRFADVMASFVFEDTINAEGGDRLATILVPYFEGYSIVARSLPRNVEDVAALLTDLIVDFEA